MMQPEVKPRENIDSAWSKSQRNPPLSFVLCPAAPKINQGNDILII